MIPQSILFHQKLVDFASELKGQGKIFKIKETGRPTIAQCYYYIDGKTKKFGFKVTCPKCGEVIDGRSEHQWDGAADVEFFDNEYKYVNPDTNPDIYMEAHRIWEDKYGGRRVISWDLPHFEL